MKHIQNFDELNFDKCEGHVFTKVKVSQIENHLSNSSDFPTIKLLCYTVSQCILKRLNVFGNTCHTAY